MINLDFIEQKFIPDLVGSNIWPQEKKEAANGKKKNTGWGQQCWWKTTGGSVLSQFNGCIPRPNRLHPSQFEASTSHRIFSIFHNCKEVLHIEINVLSVSQYSERLQIYLLATWWQRNSPPCRSQRLSKHWVLRRESSWRVLDWMSATPRPETQKSHQRYTLVPGRSAAARWIQTGSKVRRLLSPRITTEEDEKLLAVGWF